MICSHSDAAEYANKLKELEHKTQEEYYHWKYRVIKDTKKIPFWCPLKHYCKY